MALNMKHPAVKRIMQEIKEVQADKSGDFMAEALENDIFEWHFIIRGPSDTEFEGGIYHGRILLPAEYPFKPPAFMMLTPSGRFETGVKICLSISAHHPEHWQPSWSVRTALTALVAFMPSPGAGALGSLDYTKEERRKLVLKSRSDPPRFGSAERQKMIDEMHARMLTLAPPASQASSSSAPPVVDAPAAPVSQPAEPPAQAAAQPASEPLSSAAVDPPAPAPQQPPSAANTQSQGANQPPSLSPVQVPTPTAASPTAVAAQLAATTPTFQTATAQRVPEPASPCCAHAHGPALQACPATASTVTTASAFRPTGTAPAGRAVAATPPDTWALTALAVALGVLIAAILLRKALVAAGYELPPLTGAGTGTFTDGH